MIVVLEVLEILDLLIGCNIWDLYVLVIDIIIVFVVDFCNKGNGKVEIFVLFGFVNELVVYVVIGDICIVLWCGGLSGLWILIWIYSVGDFGVDVLIWLLYVWMMVIMSECGVWFKNIVGGVGEILDYYNYGCVS